MPANLEKERRFLIKIPLQWYGKFKVLTSDKLKIYQTYLVENLIGDQAYSCIRMIVDSDISYNNIDYTYTIKKFVSPGVHEEYETHLSRREYQDKLKRIDLTRSAIVKTRYKIKFNDQTFELDIFEGRLLGLAILEIEVNDINDDVLLPPYFKVIKEITGENSYSNRELAVFGKLNVL
jgi:CYTH domain-containing protein